MNTKVQMDSEARPGGDGSKRRGQILWLVRKIVIAAVVVVELVRVATDRIVEGLVKRGYFGPDPDLEEVEKEVLEPLIPTE